MERELDAWNLGAAVHILRATGTYGAAVPDFGPTDPNELALVEKERGSEQFFRDIAA